MAQTFDLQPGLGFKDGTIRLELIKPLEEKPGYWKVKRFAFSTSFKKSVGHIFIEMTEERIQELLIAYYGDMAAKDIVKSGFGRMAPHRPQKQPKTTTKSILYLRIKAWQERNILPSRQSVPVS